MNKTARLSILILMVLFVVSCATNPTSKQQLWKRYQEQSYNKAYVIASNGITAAAWGRQSTDIAIHIARVECMNKGGVDCAVVDVNGQPPEIQTATIKKSSEDDGLNESNSAEEISDFDIAFTILEDEEATNELLSGLGLEVEDAQVAFHDNANEFGLPFMVIYTEKETEDYWENLVALRKEEGLRSLSDQLIKQHLSVLGRQLVDVSDPIFFDSIRTLAWTVKYEEDDGREVSQLYANTFPEGSDEVLRTLTYLETADTDKYFDDILNVLSVLVMWVNE
jgi:hypothetical protein